MTASGPKVMRITTSPRATYFSPMPERGEKGGTSSVAHAQPNEYSSAPNTTTSCGAKISSTRYVLTRFPAPWTMRTVTAHTIRMTGSTEPPSLYARALPRATGVSEALKLHGLSAST
ncbi:hypothetical protein EYF80_034571 [Liparis tanakae]|uniref:Uncharacterized protein n=1 Tax=Liparis tanakae TaxID=230148 RepID=A0A4Z2GNJ4_9TELE|nr:hypothetical protein EYF80_034571 [Liparis tanakae]